ncbi:nwd2 [Moniliophthora roreri MCA 2997]|nr:nwd2 [Moniliophthora roreri MCA 2997]
MLWLYGPAGAGKSAIAQTIAETALAENILVASFFFSRSDPNRNNPRHIFLSIAYELTQSIPELREPIKQAIRKNLTILRGNLENQFTKLILEPCRSLPQVVRRRRGLLVVDGLDECDGGPAQQRVLRIMSTALPEEMPYQTLLCSRPEPAIREFFNTNVFRPFLRRVALDDTFEPSNDIRTFLNSEFTRIHQSLRNSHIQFPDPWPAPGVVDELVQKASGQFIYATTVVKFVDDEYSNPCTQLELVLHPSPHPDPESPSPFYDLDILYHQILATNHQHSKLQKILQAIVSITLFNRNQRVKLKLTPQHIGALLLLPGEVISTLRGMHSILHINGPDDEIHILHASFGDFLHDKGQSNDFYVGNKKNQWSFLACQMLHAIDYYGQLCGGYEERLNDTQSNVLIVAWCHWGYCCKSGLNDKVINALQNTNFTTILRSHIQQGIEMLSRGCSYLKPDKTWVLQFFMQCEQLLRSIRSQVDQRKYTGIKQYFSDYIRGFCIQITPQPNITDAESLDGVVTALVKLLLLNGWDDSQNNAKTNHHLIGTLKPEYFQTLSVGNNCHCTQEPSALTCLILPCTESTLDNVYHVQFSVAIRSPVCISAILATSKGPPTMASGEWEEGFFILMILNVGGPFPELLDLIPSKIPPILPVEAKNGILEWLQSLSPEYTSQTAPLIDQVQAVETWT